MKPRQASWLAQALLFVTRVLLAVGLTRIFMTTNGLTNVPILAPLLPALLTLGVLALLFTPPRRALITLLTLLLLTLLALLFAPESLLPLRGWLIEIGTKFNSAFFFFIGQGEITPELLAFALPAATVLISLLVHLTTAWTYAPLLPAIGLLGMMTLDAFLGLNQDVPAVALSGAAILVLLVRRMPQSLPVGYSGEPPGPRKARPPASRAPRRHSLASLLAALPVIAVALVFSFALSPLLPARIGRQQQFIEGLVDDFTQLLGIPPVQELQPDFSISFAGYYPLQNRLGGPVTLSNNPVMEVSGHNETMLLRGAIYERYDGFAWHRDARSETFRFDNALQGDLRARVFDLDQPDANVVSRGIVNSLIVETRILVTPLAAATSMIFTPGRPVSITPKTNERFQVHYDDFAMLYSKYPLTRSNPYEVVSRVPATGSQLFPNSVALALDVGHGGQLPRETLYPESYLEIPDSAPYRANGELRELALEITAGITNPYEKALAIRSYLIRNAVYNLNVAVPPEGHEFVSWFLETGEGYCVYFATAEVMLCRLAGVPARYVEGFILNQPAIANGVTTVTSDLAHAWSEVYLPYIGWVPVDATPGATQPTVTGPIEPDPAEATPTPGETDVEPTPDETEEPLPSEETPAQAEARQRRYALLGFLPLLLLAILLALEAQRRSRLLRYPLRLREAYPNPRRRAEIYWQEIQLLLGIEGLRLGNGETPISFLQRAARRHSGSEPRFAEAGRLISRIRYGRYVPRETDLAFLAGVVTRLDEQGRELHRFRHALRYTLFLRLHALDGKPRLIRGHFLKPLLRYRQRRNIW